MERLSKYDIVLMNLQPTGGAEKLGVRPCLILQGNFANETRLQTVTIAPLTTKIRPFPSMQFVSLSKENGLNRDSCIDLSQIRTVDKSSYKGTLGHLEKKYHKNISDKISEFLDLEDKFL